MSGKRFNANASANAKVFASITGARNTLIGILFFILVYLCPVITSNPTAQDIGLCGFIAATNVGSKSGYSQWSCTTGGTASSSPCLTPVWPGVSCNGTVVGGINLSSLGVTGMIM